MAKLGAWCTGLGVWTMAIRVRDMVPSAMGAYDMLPSDTVLPGMTPPGMASLLTGPPF